MAKKGSKLTEEHKQKISDTRIKLGVAKGPKNPMFGKKRPDLVERNKQGNSIETRNKISESKMGKKTGKDAANYKHGLYKTREYLNEKGRKRRALKAGAEGSYSITDLKYIYDHQQGKCPCCKKYIPFDDITVDHIVPLSWGGSNYSSNIQLLCKSCNSSKGNHNDIDYRDYVPLFLNIGDK